MGKMNYNFGGENVIVIIFMVYIHFVLLIYL